MLADCIKYSGIGVAVDLIKTNLPAGYRSLDTTTVNKNHQKKKKKEEKKEKKKKKVVVKITVATRKKKSLAAAAKSSLAFRNTLVSHSKPYSFHLTAYVSYILHGNLNLPSRKPCNLA